MTKMYLYCMLGLSLITAQLRAQGGKTYVNREFQDNTGSPTFNPILNPLGVQWSKSIRVSTGELITVGHTAVGGQEDIYVVKYDPDGNIVFSQNYDVASAGYNDYGTDIYEAANGDFLICGTTDNGTTTNYDLVVLRISSSGMLINWAAANGSAGKNDVAVAVKENAAGKVIVAGNTETSFGFSDYWVLKYNANLSSPTDNTYDYTGLNDIALGLEVVSGGDINLIGASASGTNSCDYAIATFDGTTLSFISDARSSLPGVALDEALAFCKDANDNTYITGKAWNGSNFNIKTMKINANMTVAWADTLNLPSGDDMGISIAFDAYTGAVIVGGHITNSFGHKELICIQYNATSGAKTWKHTRPNNPQQGDVFITGVTVNPANGTIYYLGGTDINPNLKACFAGKIRANGSLVWEKEIKDVSFDVLPSDLEFTSDGLYVISILNPISPTYQTTLFSEFEADSSKHYNGSGKATYKKNELIVRFKASAMNTAAIDNQVGSKISEFGHVSDFLTEAAYDQLNLALEGLCLDCNIKATKIFPGLATTFTSSTSRLAQTIDVPDLWTALLLTFPSSVSIRDVQLVFKNLNSIIAYSEPNYLAEVYSTPPPDDTYYTSDQASLHSTTLYPSAHINVEEAWDIVPSGGKPYVYCGVFDTGVDYTHTDLNNQVIGWDFRNNQGIFNNNYPDTLGHGTNVGGIIGAKRNNNFGIAGIAGGEYGSNNSNGSQGVQLVSLNILHHYLDVALAVDAILGSSVYGGNQGFNYGLHLSNNSWGFIPDTLAGPDTTFYLLSEAVHFANRSNVTFVAARGNDGYNSPNYPVNTDDDWVLSVGATGKDGNYCNLSNCEVVTSYGHNMDVGAPGSAFLTLTLKPGESYQYIGQTSMAAAHVTGVAGLLMSYMNDPQNHQSYQNLAPEDVEEIIQRSANNVWNPTYNDLTGYGRVDAGKALRMVEKPFRGLYHFGTNNSSPIFTKTIYSNVDTVTLREPYENLNSNWFQKGKYIVKTYKIDATVFHNFSFGTDSLMYYWPRPSSSAPLELFDSSKKLLPRQRVIMNSCNGTSASLTGYIYQVKDLSGTPVGWWPCDTSFAALGSSSLFEYSVLVKNTAVGIKEHSKKQIGVKLFPNPAKHEQTLLIDTELGADLKVDLYDLMGRHLRTVYKGKATAGKTTIISPIQDLPNSMYIYVIKVDEKVAHEKFIKE